MARRLHFSRLLDIISGSALAGANTKVQKSALHKDFDIAKLESKKLRDLIDSNLPTFYVVDLDTIVNELSHGLGLTNFRENEDYVKAQLPTKEELRKFLLNVLKDAMNKLPKKPFMASYDQVVKEYNKLIDSLAKRTTYIGYRNAASRFGADIRRILKTSGVYVASDGDAIVANLTPNSYVVIGPTFNGAVESVNKLINTELRTAFSKNYDVNLKEYNADPKNRFTIGDFINAGHTAAYAEKGGLIGVNMPFAQERQFLLSGTEKALGIDAAVADLYLDAGYAIKFKQNFTESAKNLLDMQFSFTISMPAKYNTATLRTQELQRIKEYIGNTILPDIKEQAKRKFDGGLLDDTILNTSASPTLPEFIRDAVIDSIKGKAINRVVKTSTAKAKGTVKSHVIVKDPQPTKLKAKSGGTSIQSQAFKYNQGDTHDYSLTSLQLILADKLFETIKKNMGTGARRDVLNYRTGRFAQSVKIERLSQGREGMITAFYSYMKNPYATFSDGGAQQFPRSRDPKTLISRSIREILAEKVSNKLRAVSV